MYLWNIESDYFHVKLNKYMNIRLITTAVKDYKNIQSLGYWYQKLRFFSSRAFLLCYPSKF